VSHYPVALWMMLETEVMHKTNINKIRLLKESSKRALYT
jgi:hypothetical protein